MTADSPADPQRTSGLTAARRPLILSFLTMGATQAGRLLGALVLARALGPDARGLVAAAVLWPSVLIGLASLGLAEAATVHLAGAGARQRGVVTTLLAMSVGIATALMLVGLFVVPAALSSHGAEAVRLGLIVLLFIPASFIATTMIAALNGLQRVTTHYAARFVLGNGYVILIIPLAVAGLLDARSALIAQIAGPAAAAVLALAMLRRQIVSGWPSVAIARILLSYGARVHTTAIVTLISQRADQILIALFLSTQDLGFYVVALSYGGMIGLPGTGLTLVALPLLAHASPEDRRRTGALLVGSTTLLTLACAVPLAVLAPFLIPWGIGEEFSSAVLPAQILTLGLIPWCTAAMLTSVLQADGRPGAAAAGEVAGLLVKLALFTILMPVAGLSGAILAACAGYAATALWQGFMVSRHLRLSVRELLVPDLRALRSFLGGRGGPTPADGR